MKKIITAITTILIQIFLVSNCFSGISSNTKIPEKPTVQTFQTFKSDCEVLRDCHLIFKEKEILIQYALENSNIEILGSISTEFLELAKNENGSLELDSQYFLYLSINLISIISATKGERISGDITQTFIKISRELAKKLKLCKMDLPLPIPPASYFEQPKCCKAMKEIEIFYSHFEKDLEKALSGCDPEFILGFMEKITRYTENQNLTNITRFYILGLVGQIGTILNGLFPGMAEKNTIDFVSKKADSAVKNTIEIIENCECLN